MKCDDCEIGYYASNAKATKCLKCGVGTYTNQKRSAKCKECEAGSHSVEARDKCLLCMAGSFAAKKKSGECTKCPAGKYQPDEGATSCLKCLAGSYSKEGAAKCTQCPAGQFQNEEGKSSCNLCPRGQFARNPGSTACTKCSKDWYQPQEGKAECLKCPAGVKSQEGRPVCDGCPPGKDIGQIRFVSGDGEAGSDKTESGFKAECPFTGNCPGKRPKRYWKSKDISTGKAHLYFKFKRHRVVVAFSFQAVEKMVPWDGKQFEFYGTNEANCVSKGTVLYIPRGKSKQRLFRIETEKWNSYLCYGFKLRKDDDQTHAAFRPPIRVKQARSGNSLRHKGDFRREVAQESADKRSDH